MTGSYRNYEILIQSQKNCYSADMNTVIPRAPWPESFPDVIVHGDLNIRNSHRDYAAAKSGDATAALNLVRDMLANDGMTSLQNLFKGQKPLVLPVAALEVTGFNAIPDAMAQEIARRLGLTAVSGTVVQSNKVAHTKSDGWHRLVTPAMFTGTIISGADYLLVDDHVCFGGTFANLRGYIEANGGHVLGVTTLTETSGARKIAIRPKTQSVLQLRHGEKLDHFWKAVFGHGTECLTDIEAGYLSRVESLDAIRNRMAQAAERARSSGLSPITISCPRP